MKKEKKKRQPHVRKKGKERSEHTPATLSLIFISLTLQCLTHLHPSLHNHLYEIINAKLMNQYLTQNHFLISNTKNPESTIFIKSSISDI